MAKKAKIRARRISSNLMAGLLKDLCNRLQEQAAVAEALADVARPPGTVIAATYPMLKVLELAACQHAQTLRQVAVLAEIVRDRQAGN
jgi:hypothetical protein